MRLGWHGEDYGRGSAPDAEFAECFGLLVELGGSQRLPAGPTTLLVGADADRGQTGVLHVDEAVLRLVGRGYSRSEGLWRSASCPHRRRPTRHNSGTWEWCYCGT